MICLKIDKGLLQGYKTAIISCVNNLVNLLRITEWTISFYSEFVMAF